MNEIGIDMEIEVPFCKFARGLISVEITHKK
jgi:hypothetical protein